MTSLPTATVPFEADAAGRRLVVGGIDTHKDLHVAAVIDASEAAVIDASENVLGTAFGCLITCPSH